jgi:deoxyadenosine/deoxycytidine kinase
MRIAIEGNIGAGKSTILAELARRGWATWQEPVDSWDLEGFYSDPSRYAFEFSLGVLLSFCRMRPADGDESAALLVERCPLACRHVFTQLLFNDGHLTQTQWAAFKECADLLSWAPDAVVYVDVPAEVCLRRIAERGRRCEAAVDVQYLRRLEFQYDTLFKFAVPVVHRVDGTAPDVVDRVESVIRDICNNCNDKSKTFSKS